MPKLTWPGYNYLGPGNPIRNGHPINSLDRKARIHDIQYSQAKTKEDIYASDSQALSSFSNEGALGILSAGALGAKTLTEQAIGGTIYPNMATKRIADSTSDEPEEKHQKLDEYIGRMDETHNSGTPSNAAGQVVPYTIQRPFEFSATKTFKKTFQLYTGGYKWGKANNTQPFAPLPQLFLANSIINYTSMAVLDPSFLGLYLTRAQREQLNKGDHAKSCRIKITPLGYRLPFATAEVGSTWANSATLVQTVHGVGIEAHLPTRLVKYSADPADLTTVTSCGHPVLDDQWDLLHGTGTDFSQIPAGWLIPRHWNQYATFMSPNSINLDLGTMYAINNIQDVKGTPIIEYKYEFKNGLLKDPKCFMEMADVNFRAETRMDVPGFVSKQMRPSADTFEHAGFTPDGSHHVFNNPIERSYQMNMSTENVQSAKVAPNLYFGVMPVQSNAPLAPTAEFADVVVQWCVETELVVETMNTPISQSDFNYFSTKFYDPSYKDVRTNRCTFYSSKRVVHNTDEGV